MSLADADENEDTVILAVSSPRYDNQTGTLIYTARILEDPRDDRLSYQISRADAGIPEKFGQAKIIVGGCSGDEWQCCTSEGDDCKTIGISCCSFIGGCEPCGRDCEYKAKCRKEHGGTCGDVKCDVESACDFN